MKKILSIIALVCVVLAVKAEDIPGNQVMQKESRIVTEFQEVDVKADFNIDIAYAVSPAVSVEAESNLLPYIKTELKGKTLKVYVDKKVRLAPNFPITVHLATPAITKISYTGEGNIEANAIPSSKMEFILSGKGQCEFNNLGTGNLKVTANKEFDITMTNVKCSNATFNMQDNSTANISNFEGSKVNFETSTLANCHWTGAKIANLTIKSSAAGLLDFTGFAGENVTATFTGTGKTAIGGTGRNLTVTTSNAADFDAIGLACEKVKVTNNGTGDIKVASSSSLDVTITSSGNVTFKGDLKISFNSAGPGQLIKSK